MKVRAKHILPVNKLYRDTKSIRHVFQCQAAIRFQELSVRQYPHLAHVESGVRSEQPITVQNTFDFSYTCGGRKKNCF